MVGVLSLDMTIHQSRTEIGKSIKKRIEIFGTSYLILIVAFNG